MAGQGFASLNISGSSGRGFFKVSNLVRVAELLVLRQNTKLCFPSSLTSVASAFMEPRARIQSTHTHTHTNTCIHNTYIYICMYMYMYMYVEHAHVYMSLHTYIYIYRRNSHPTDSHICKSMARKLFCEQEKLQLQREGPELPRTSEV